MFSTYAPDRLRLQNYTRLRLQKFLAARKKFCRKIVDTFLLYARLRSMTLSKICCALSFGLFFSIGWQTFYKLPPQTLYLLNLFDTIVCLFYVADWTNVWRQKGFNFNYLKWGWFDLLLAVPFSQAIWVQYHTVIRFFRAPKAGRRT